MRKLSLNREGLLFLRCMAAVSVALGSVPAWAQTPEGDASNAPAAAAGSATAAPAQGPGAQEAGSATEAPRRAWIITPSVAADFVHTDNVRLEPNGQSDNIVTLSPGINIRGGSARIKGTLDYRLQRVSYMDQGRADRYQRSMSANGTAELVDNWLFLDVSSRISRQAVSAFAAPNTNTYAANANVVETSSFTAAPVIKGNLAGAVDYMVRYEIGHTSSASASLPNFDSETLIASLSGGTSFSRLNWGIDSNTSTTTYANDSSNEISTLRANLNYLLDRQLKVTFITGRESNDIASPQKSSSSIEGYGFEWTPTPRTKIKYTNENRFFGKGYNLEASHRWSRSALRLTSSRDVQLRPPQFATGDLSLLDFNAMMLSQFTGIPQAEALRLVQAELLAQGIDPNASSGQSMGFLNSGSSLNTQQGLTYTISGVRNTVTFNRQRSERQRIGGSVGLSLNLLGDFANTNRIVMLSNSMSWGYRLSPISSLSYTLTKTRTTGDAVAETELMSNALNYTTKLGAKTTGSLGLRQTKFDGTTGLNYTERAISGGLLYTF